jgi:hypothetical protein
VPEPEAAPPDAPSPPPFVPDSVVVPGPDVVPVPAAPGPVEPVLLLKPRPLEPVPLAPVLPLEPMLPDEPMPVLPLEPMLPVPEVLEPMVPVPGVVALLRVGDVDVSRLAVPVVDWQPASAVTKATPAAIAVRLKICCAMFDSLCANANVRRVIVASSDPAACRFRPLPATGSRRLPR